MGLITAAKIRKSLELSVYSLEKIFVEDILMGRSCVTAPM